MSKSIAILFAFVAVVQQCFSTVVAEACIDSYAALQELDTARGNNNSIPVTYVICPNTVFQMTDFDTWALNGNTNYLCGADGASTNNCVVTGGQYQMEIATYPFDRSNKDNILLSGFTFEKAGFFNAAVSFPGKSTLRNCIFKDNNNHGVLIADYAESPTVRRRTRRLGSSANKNEPDEFDHDKDIQQRMNDRRDRSLLIGGGSEPRMTLLLDRVQFLNNSLTSNVRFPSVVSNGPFNIFSAFADVTVSRCLFKDNYFPYNDDSLSPGFGIKVQSSATLNIANSCLVNNFFAGPAPVTIQSDSGLIASRNNYATEIPLNDNGRTISPCQYMFKAEAYKCFVPERNVCGLPACAASYKLYNAGTDKVVTNIVNGGTIRSPPCDLNIEVVLPCATTGKNVTLQLLHQNGTIAKTRDQIKPFFLYGNQKANVLAGKLASGTYKIQAVANGIVQPSPTTFSLAGQCVRS